MIHDSCVKERRHTPYLVRRLTAKSLLASFCACTLLGLALRPKMWQAIHVGKISIMWMCLFLTFPDQEVYLRGMVRRYVSGCVTRVCFAPLSSSRKTQMSSMFFAKVEQPYLKLSTLKEQPIRCTFHIIPHDSSFASFYFFDELIFQKRIGIAQKQSHQGEAHMPTQTSSQVS